MAFKPDIILEHELVPKHEILKKTEVEELCKKYNITMGQLPKIKTGDPVAQVIGAKRGDVLRITRKSMSAGEAVYYRAVVL